jgi:hypothetical protein
MGSPIFPLGTSPEEKQKQANGEAYGLLIIAFAAAIAVSMMAALGCP